VRTLRNILDEIFQKLNLNMTNLKQLNMDLKSNFNKIKEIPYALCHNKKYLAILILILIITLISFPITTEIDNNVTTHHSIIDLGIADYGFSSAIIVGLLGFMATIYTNDKNLKMTKLSLIPETLTVKTRLENRLIGYYMDQKYHPPDQISFLTDILNIKSEDEVIFRLLAPKSYRRLQYLFSDSYEDWYESDEIHERNAKSIVNEILWAVFNEKYHIEEDGRTVEGYDYENFTYIDAKIRCENKFQYPLNDDMPLTDLSQCSDDVEIDEVPDTVEIYMNKQQLLDYINTIPQIETKELALEKFEKIIQILDDIFKELQNELSNYKV